MNELQGSDFRVFGAVEHIAARRPVGLTFGNFDGVHRGHQKILAELKALSAPYPTVAFTFDPHPAHVLRDPSEKPLLMTLQERVDALLAAGADIVYVQRFDPEFATLTADAFCETFLPSRFDVRAAVLGFNFCYGRDRQGCWAHFMPFARKFGWKASQPSPLLLDGVEVSSSKVREFVLQGEVAEAARYLGRPYGIAGTVVQGDQRGRLLGFPTANLFTEKKILPANGVYAVRVDVEGMATGLPAVMNCGVRPTVAKGLHMQLESHILDFTADIYGRAVKFHLLRYLREELRFGGLDALKAQISLDVASARTFFKWNPPV